MTHSFHKWLAIAGILSLGAASLAAQENAALIDMLVKKGIITDKEAEQLQADLAKDTADAASAEKLKLYTGLTELRISGDVRIRYEYRQGESLTDDNVERSRFRYRLRPMITGKLGDDWVFGFRLENGSGSRSSNVTMADDGGPWNKTSDAVYVGQVYIGYIPNPNMSFYAGRMPNPFVSTSMIWDPDINPEGLAEKFKMTSNNITYFANVGQFLYDSGNPQNSAAPTPNRKDLYLLGWQGGATVMLNKTDSIQVAPTIYQYVNNSMASKDFAGNFSPANVSGINNLLVLDMPMEYDFTNVRRKPAERFRRCRLQSQRKGKGDEIRPPRSRQPGLRLADRLSIRQGEAQGRMGRQDLLSGHGFVRRRSQPGRLRHI